MSFLLRSLNIWSVFSLKGLENVGVYLAVCVLILSEILAKVAHQTCYRPMWAAENMFHLQARCNKDIQSRWKNPKCMYLSFYNCLEWLWPPFLSTVVEYSLRSSKNKVKKIVVVGYSQFLRWLKGSFESLE